MRRPLIASAVALAVMAAIAATPATAVPFTERTGYLYADRDSAVQTSAILILTDDRTYMAATIFDEEANTVESGWGSARAAIDHLAEAGWVEAIVPSEIRGPDGEDGEPGPLLGTGTMRISLRWRGDGAPGPSGGAIGVGGIRTGFSRPAVVSGTISSTSGRIVAFINADGFLRTEAAVL